MVQNPRRPFPLAYFSMHILSAFFVLHQVLLKKHYLTWSCSFWGRSLRSVDRLSRRGGRRSSRRRCRSPRSRLSSTGSGRCGDRYGSLRGNFSSDQYGNLNFFGILRGFRGDGILGLASTMFQPSWQVRNFDVSGAQTGIMNLQVFVRSRTRIVKELGVDGHNALFGTVAPKREK